MADWGCSCLWQLPCPDELLLSIWTQLKKALVSSVSSSVWFCSAHGFESAVKKHKMKKGWVLKKIHLDRPRIVWLLGMSSLYFQSDCRDWRTTQVMMLANLILKLLGILLLSSLLLLFVFLITVWSPENLRHVFLFPQPYHRSVDKVMEDSESTKSNAKGTWL